MSASSFSSPSPTALAQDGQAWLRDLPERPVTAAAVLALAERSFGAGCALATSFGPEDVVLLHLAKEHGFVLPKPSEAPAAPSPEVLAQRERERVERQQAEQARQQAAHAAAAADAVAQWEAASDTGASPYLVRKGVQAHGVRFAADGCVLVPLRDAAGALWNLQRIAPNARPMAPTSCF